MADAGGTTSPALAAPVAETPPSGLSGAEVAERRLRGLVNEGGERTSRSVAEILRANILTRFNFILGVLLAVIVVAAPAQDALFGVVLVTNAVIGIGQELAPSGHSTGSPCSTPPGFGWCATARRPRSQSRGSSPVTWCCCVPATRWWRPRSCAPAWFAD